MAIDGKIREIFRLLAQIGVPQATWARLGIPSRLKSVVRAPRLLAGLQFGPKAGLSGA